MLGCVIIISCACVALGALIGISAMDNWWAKRMYRHVDRKLKRRK